MFTPIESSIFFSKNDSEDLRLGDFATHGNISSLSAEDIALVGYPDDEGIKLNGGRIGAALAPQEIRKFLYKMTPAYNFNRTVPQIKDFGNVAILNSIDERHNQALKLIQPIYTKKSKIISLGGGHDYGYVDGHAFIENNIKSEHKPLIINFDAHLDVRPNTHSNNSGTPFFRLKNKFKDQFNLIEVGLQPQCNSRNHWDWAKRNSIATISLQELEKSNWDLFWKNSFISNLTKETPVFISFDIDALQSADAGGCSQAWPTGLKLQECLNVLDIIYKKSNTQSLGIYEVSPPYDHDNKTSKAAVLLIYQFIFS